MINQFFSLLAKYLTQHKEWIHTHTKSIGDIEKTYPWREDVWIHKSGYYIVRFHSLKHNPIMSAPTPEYTWRISNSNYNWTLSFQYGVVK